MKNIISRQIILFPVLYVIAKLLWDSMPVEKLPVALNNVVSDLLGPSFLMAIVLWLFIFILWRIPLFELLSQFFFGTKPNIQGTWRGKLKYEWEKKKSEKTVFLVINQKDGYSLHIWLLTDERTSISIFANIQSYKGVQRIFYTYSNEESPVNKEKNPSHEGFCQLDIVNSLKILQGIYYTDRKTFGELCFDKRSRRKVLNYKEAKKLFGI